MDISKIGRAIGKATSNAKTMASDAKTGFNFIDKTFFDKGFRKDSLIGEALGEKHGRHLKKSVTTTALVGGTALAVGTSSIESNNVAKMGGKIDVGEGLSSMTSSVQLSPGIQKMQKGENVKFNNSLDNAGADGDIVFALHRMR